MLNETHDPARRSWVQSANDPSTDFPLQNLPFGVCRPRGSSAEFRACVAIGDQVLDLSAARDAGAFEGDPSKNVVTTCASMLAPAEIFAFTGA